MKELIIGCGKQKGKKLFSQDKTEDYNDPTTLDINPEVEPDVVHDLEVLPLPFKDDSFDEIHAYDVLEHTGQQGDYKFFFDQFSEFWRILKPNGILCAKVPTYDSIWTWGDPGHKRIINKGSLVFLSQKEYTKQVDETTSPMTDYRNIYTADFDTVSEKAFGSYFGFVLSVVKGVCDA